MKAGIVGGSIAGCSAAYLLRNEGHDVTVFERSNKPLEGRGGGIGTTPKLINQIKKDGLLKDDFAYVQIDRMSFVGKTNQSEPYGRTAWEMPINFNVFQWNALWKKLRIQIPDEHYHTGVKIMAARMTPDDKVELVTSTHEKRVFDLVLFADGYNSLGRRILFPEKKLKYRGYVLWRGLLPEREMSSKSPIQHEILRLSYKGKPGHNVVYFIPNENGSVKEGDRAFNWAAYIPIPESELDELMTDKSGKVRNGTLPPGHLTETNETRLKDFITQNTPEYYAEMVNKTTDSYIQVIYTLDLNKYYKDKICLIGDAGIVVQPFTGSGVFKGYHNIKDLIDSLNNNKNLDSALDQWSSIQVATGKRLLALGDQMEKAFIWEPLDFAEVDEESTQNWWKKSVAFPENFNYETE